METKSDKDATLKRYAEMATRYLHEAVKKGQFDLVKSFLATPEGMDVNVRDGYGMTALMWAAGRGSQEIALLLLQRGADVDARNELLSIHSIEMLETGENNYEAGTDRMGLLHANKRHGWTALAWAARNGQTEIVRLLHAHGANVNAITRDGCTALVHAIEGRHESTAFALLELGADPSLEEDGCSPALPRAAAQGFFGLVQAILDRGGNVNALDNRHMALCMAVANNQPQILKLLLDHGLDPDAVSHSLVEWPPLHFAANNDALECAEILLERGANIDAKDTLNGMTALEFAVDEMVGPRVARLLIERGASIRSAIGRVKWFMGLAEADEIAEAEEILRLLKSRHEDVAGS